MTEIVTAAEVKTLLGVDVESHHLAMAHADVDRLGGVDLDDANVVARVKPRDLKQLKWAIAYQAAWLSSQIEVHARMDVTQITGSSSDGGITVRDELTQILSPQARSALERVSWKTKTTKTVPRRRPRLEGPLYTTADITIHTDPVDTYAQLSNALHDAGPWAEAPDRATR
jgi:hypothetical protein